MERREPSPHVISRDARYRTSPEPRQDLVPVVVGVDVCHGKALFPGGCESRPTAKAPVGSSQSGPTEVTKWTEALWRQRAA